MTCSVVPCSAPPHARGLCTGHYDRLMRGAGLHPEIPLGQWPRDDRVEHWFCECDEPILGIFNECQRCLRKPRALLGVMEQR